MNNYWRENLSKRDASTLFLALIALLTLTCRTSTYAEHPYVIEWTRQVSTTVDTSVSGVAIDDSGNVLLRGSAQGDLGPGHVGGNDVYVRKYDPDGDTVWTSQFGTTADERGWGIALSNTGKIYIGGSTSGNFHGINAGESDGFLSRLDASGNIEWVRQFGTPADDVGHELVIDASGGVYLSGHTEGDLDGANAGGWDVFVSKYDIDGNPQWTRQFGTTSNEFPSGATTDIFGNFIVAGYTSGDLTGGGLAPQDCYVVKYSNDGDLVWTRQFGTSGTEQAHDVVTDDLGNIYVSGRTSGDLEGTNAGFTDTFIRKYDKDGEVQWTAQVGDASLEAGWSIAVSESGNVFVSGFLNGGIPSGPNREDAFVSKFDPEGQLLWTQSIVSSNSDVGLRVAVDGLENVYATIYEFRLGVDDPKHVSYLIKLIPALLLGDANNDGVVDAADLLAIELNMGAVGIDNGLLLGDANDDGRVDGDDWLSVEQHLGDVFVSDSVPEPGSLMLLIPCAAALGLRGKLKQPRGPNRSLTSF